MAVNELLPGTPGDPTTGVPVTPSSVPEPRSFVLSPAQLTILVVCAVSIYFVISFYGKSLDSFRVTQRANAVTRENAQLVGQIEELMERVTYYSTDAFVETAAREKLNLVKAGDRPMVILHAGADIATVAPPPAPVDTPRPFAEIGYVADWLQLFFDPH